MQVDLTQAAAIIKRGDVVAIPTETVYGLAADANNEDALKQVYAIKQRPTSNPLIVHIANSEQVLDWASEFSPLAQQLAKAFWPGPLTMVLPAKSEVLDIVRAGEPTVALRVPSHPVAQQLLQILGMGLAAPSANKYTQLSPTTAAHVLSGLGDHVPILDGGACCVGIESTIIYVAGNQWRVLRLGMITAAEIEMVVGFGPELSNQSLPKAPGQHVLHYSPKTPIQLFTSKNALWDYAKTHPDCSMLLIDDEVISLPNKTFYLPNNPATVAERLYDTLHQMDALGTEAILIELPPKTIEWFAIHDRLSRAAYKLN